jgi:hypothetical protein
MNELVQEIKTLEFASACCPNSMMTKVRVVFAAEKTAPNNVMRSLPANRGELITFKALLKRNGRSREYEVKRVGSIGSSNPLLQGVQAVGSMALPGDSSILRSPIRSTVFGALTPGMPSIPGLGGLPGRGLGGRDRTYHCPEGYQYGGRFTDKKFSNCGAKLFDIPGPLGLAIAAIRAVRNAIKPGPQTQSETLGAGQYPESIVDSRAPQIPRVSLSNPQKLKLEVDKLVTPLGKQSSPVARMVRRDGFVLEPVVPASVLRTVPDNRNMEGATYISNHATPDTIGKDELGLLSNTGIQSLKYVLPGGSVLTLEKKRPLTVGERRKLGRTVNAAIESSNDKDPASRLKMVATETGDGIGYSEKFVGISNPNEIGPDGKERWASTAFKKQSGKPTEQREAQPVQAAAAPQTDIGTVDGAINHIKNGGSLADIAPDILQEVLKKMREIKTQKINDRQSLVSMPNGDKLLLNSSVNNFDHIGQRFASAVQEHLGIKAPDVYLVGAGDKRNYLVQDAETAIRGAKIDRNSKFADSSPMDVTRLMFADILTDTRNRNIGTIALLSEKDNKYILATSNPGSGLTGLDEISITKRTEMSIEELLSPSESSIYINYFQILKELQQAQYQQFIATLIQRARAFNFSNFKSNLYNDGKLSQGEKIHLNILEKLFTQRLGRLTNARDSIYEIVSAKK